MIPGVGDRVRCGLAGSLYGTLGSVNGVEARHGSTQVRVWIRWEGFVLSNGYPLGHPMLEALQPVGA